MSLKGVFVAGPWDDGCAVTGHCYNVSAADPSRSQVWGYSGRLSYAPDEVLALHAMSSAAEARMEVEPCAA